ncbi:hypothetical protein DID77_02580 [Candidatus Marinamargulisbacteria bacterium SCGC AG-439-L15]|nr:hypothetical protein DID77_02580 [Candidatus Marinamargulisbacteria bacterium SCGC AG-439-L15]
MAKTVCLLNLKTTLLAGFLIYNQETVLATTYMSAEQAKSIIWKDSLMTPYPITLSKEEVKTISKASKTRVRTPHIKAWKTKQNGWFILDQVIGKHENIDIAVGIDNQGNIVGVEILEYRETYGGEIRNPAWLAQFYKKRELKVLKLDKDIKNISGATLSCRHITDGINRLSFMWEKVLKHL